jgi:hypothetical protein
MRLLYLRNQLTADLTGRRRNDAVSGIGPGRTENTKLPGHRSKISLHGLDYKPGVDGAQVYTEKKDTRRRIHHDPMVQNTIKHFGYVNGIQILHMLRCDAKSSSGS